MTNISNLILASVALIATGCGGAEATHERVGRTRAAVASSDVCPAYTVAPEGPTATIDITDSSLVYTPPCLQVKAGTAVTIGASMIHPLDALPLEDDDAVAANPFADPSALGWVTSQTQTLTAPGLYGYYCTLHADPSTGVGMTGVIKVVP